MMADMVLDRIDPEKKRKSPPPAAAHEATRYILAETRRAVFQRAGSRCEYINPETKIPCNSGIWSR